MYSRDDYFTMISRRGTQGGPGLLELLDWCGKTGLYQVTEEEARAFWEAPDSPCVPPKKKD